MKLQNDLLLRALALDPDTPRAPVWLMRQAGRYLPEYRALRAEAGDIIRLFKTPELACQAAMQPLARYPLDAAILFSDILTIPDAMGLGLYFVEGEGPCFEHPLRSVADVRRLPIPDPAAELNYVLEAVRLTVAELGGRLPLIGFSGSPWTLAAYMIEGRGGSSFARLRQMCSEQPELLTAVLEKLAQSVGLYLDAQIEAGARCVQIFDTWGGLLVEREEYRNWSLQWIQQALSRVRSRHNGCRISRIVYVRDRGRALEELAEVADCVGIDSATELVAARQRAGGRCALQGNLASTLLDGSPAAAVQATHNILDSWGGHPGLIFNLGEGIAPSANPETVGAVIEACVGR